MKPEEEELSGPSVILDVVLAILAREPGSLAWPQAAAALLVACLAAGDAQALARAERLLAVASSLHEKAAGRTPWRVPVQHLVANVPAN